jgi:hypothetical protein
MSHDTYRGICIVHARYEGVQDSDILSVKQTKQSSTHDCFSEGSSKGSDISSSVITSKISHNDHIINPEGSNELKEFTRTKTDDIELLKDVDLCNNLDAVSIERNKDNDLINGFTSIIIDTKNMHKYPPKKLLSEHYSRCKNDDIKTESDNNGLSHNFLHDFTNFSPDRYQILRGIGYIRSFNHKQYVVTCNHIMVKYSSYVGYCTDITSKLVKFDMIIYRRIPELDIVIMEILNPLDNPLPDLPTADKLQEYYDASSDNMLVTGEYIPQKPCNEVEFKTINLNHAIHVVFDILTSKHIHQIPLLNLPVYEMDVVKKIAIDQKFDLRTDMKIMNTKRQSISKMIAGKLAGTSGSIVRSNNANIGMCCLFTDTENGVFLKALPIFLIDIVVNNVITLGCDEFMGIRIDTYGCDIEHLHEHMQAHYVIQQSCNYINGKKVFSFNKGDVILEVDGNRFNKNMMVHCDIINMNVPLNTYLMIKSNKHPELPVTIKISKQSHNDSKIRIHNLACISYNDMYYCRITSKTCCRWNDMVFIDLSEELVMFYKRLGINITNGLNLDNAHVSNEKIVILFNYMKKINDVNLTKEYYTSMPYLGQYGYYFFQVKIAGRKKISSVDDITNTLKMAIKQNQKQITFKLCNNIGIEKLLKMNI